MKRTVCSFMSFKKSQHTNPGKKDLKHTERSKTHHDIFSFALNSEFGTFFLVWMLPQAPESLSLIGSLQCSLLQTTWKFFDLFNRIYQAVSFGELVLAEGISFLCRWHWLPIFVWGELLFQRIPLWFEHQSHLSWSPLVATAVSG